MGLLSDPFQTHGGAKWVFKIGSVTRQICLDQMKAAAATEFMSVSDQFVFFTRKLWSSLCNRTALCCCHGVDIWHSAAAPTWFRWHSHIWIKRTHTHTKLTCVYVCHSDGGNRKQYLISAGPNCINFIYIFCSFLFYETRHVLEFREIIM